MAETTPSRSVTSVDGMVQQGTREPHFVREVGMLQRAVDECAGVVKQAEERLRPYARGPVPTSEEGKEDSVVEAVQPIQDARIRVERMTAELKDLLARLEL